VPLGIPLHLQLHKLRTDVKWACHNHPLYGTVWADMGEVPPIFDQSSALGGGGALALVDEYDGPVNDPNTARRAIEKMDGAHLALLAGHGVSCWAARRGRCTSGRSRSSSVASGLACPRGRIERGLTAARGLPVGDVALGRRGLHRLLGSHGAPGASRRPHPAGLTSHSGSSTPKWLIIRPMINH